MQEKYFSVGVYKTQHEAMGAMEKLSRKGFPMQNVSILGQDIQHYTNTEGSETPAIHFSSVPGVGTFWSSVYGIQVGIGFLAIPNMGELTVIGALTRILIGEAEESVNNSAGIGLFKSMKKMGISKESIIEHRKYLMDGKLLVIAYGNRHEAEIADPVLERIETTVK